MIRILTHRTGEAEAVRKLHRAAAEHREVSKRAWSATLDRYELTSEALGEIGVIRAQAAVALDKVREAGGTDG